MTVVYGGSGRLCVWVLLLAPSALLLVGIIATEAAADGSGDAQDQDSGGLHVIAEDNSVNECYIYKTAIDSLMRAFAVLQEKQETTEEGEDGEDEEIPRHITRPADCYDIMLQDNTENGIYEIFPSSCRRRDWGIRVYCELYNNTGWTVVLRRQEQDDQTDFYRNWREYRDGFGEPNGEYWIGNEALHELSSSGSQQRLRIELEDWDGNKRWAEYKNFEVSEEDSQYQLHIGEYSGDAGDALRIHDGMRFTTYDMDNDSWGSNCAERWKGGFWYEACYRANPMGIYFKKTKSDKGITWRAWYSDSTVLKTVEFKIRPDTSTDGDAW
ncbi:unnamed protein product [Meganyctiphanes norvegica]|uniref:Fibrinogen C-terminal domain-containing protein n=1 Tax=Meganyctiphanes norvegica TaxID=48144 RepID=A0AAV2Q1T5_MEGNR